MLTRYTTKKIAQTSLFALAILIVLGYGVFATHDFFGGPSIFITEPQNGASFTSPDVRIKGVVKRIQDISLNGRSITIDDQGNFNEAAILAPGYNVFELVARDKFGRSKDVRLQLVYKVN